METDAQTKQRIMESAREEFFRHGFSKVTVEEIAAKNGISKKTIYKYFDGKDDLVEAVSRETMSEMARCCQSIVDEQGVDYVDKLKRMMTMVAVQYSKLGRPLIEDLQKNAPRLWNEIAASRTQRINIEFGAMLREGMEKGVFRNDIDRDLILMIYANAIQTIINPEMLVHLPYTAAQIFETIVKVIFEGILTEEAKPKYLSQPPLLTVAQQRV